MPLLRVLQTPIFHLRRRKPGDAVHHRDLLAASTLPAELRALVAQVVRRSRLKRREKVDLTRELLSHFDDALSAGRSPAAALTDFGDPNTAAKLIRRSVIRKRPWWWHAFRAVRWTALMLCIAYVGLGILFLTGKPKPAVDYVSKIRHEMRVPDADRGWPLYREAFLVIFPPSARTSGKAAFNAMANARPGSEHWEELVAFTSAHQPELELIRQASAKRAVGFIVGLEGSASDRKLFPAPPLSDTFAGLNAEQHGLIALWLPYLRFLHDACNLLEGDAHAAAEQRDLSRAIADAEAMAGIARQLARESLLISKIISSGIQRRAIALSSSLLQTHGSAITDQMLVHLAHTLGDRTLDADLVNLAGERYFAHDIIQRTFTDDGQGNGRLTPEILKFVPISEKTLGRKAGEAATNERLLTAASGLIVLAAPSRKEMIEASDRILDLAQSLLQTPRRAANYAELDNLIAGYRRSPGLSLLLQLVPSAVHVANDVEAMKGQRDGLLIAIAIEAYRRRHGHYPESLTALSPEFLPAVPVDLITGNPLHYKLTLAGTPLLYSVGANLADDGGIPPTDKSGTVANHLAAQWNLTPARAPKGDWILYPQPAPITQPLDNN